MGLFICPILCSSSPNVSSLFRQQSFIDFCRRTTRAIEISITKNLPLSSRAVKNWHICRVLVAHLVMAACEWVLVTRGEDKILKILHILAEHVHCTVYAMYNRARWVLVFFVSLFIAETAVVVVGIFRSLPHQFQLQDALTTVPLSFAYFAYVHLSFFFKSNQSDSTTSGFQYSCPSCLSSSYQLSNTFECR